MTSDQVRGEAGQAEHRNTAGVLSRVVIVSDQSPDMTEIAGAESPVHVYQEIDSIDQGDSKGWS